MGEWSVVGFAVSLALFLLIISVCLKCNYEDHSIRGKIILSQNFVYFDGISRICPLTSRITSYNVCYTKLLRLPLFYRSGDFQFCFDDPFARKFSFLINTTLKHVFHFTTSVYFLTTYGVFSII